MPDPDWLAAARALMTTPRRGACGPYELLTDAADPRLDATCAIVAATAEAGFREHLGVELVGPSRGAVVVFSRRSDFRSFVSAVSTLPAGYSGFSRASRSIVALPAGDDPWTFAATLTHELVHLLQRRAFGPGLPPWLAEGLAQVLSDEAGAGEAPHSPERSSIEARRQRLRAAHETGVLRPIAELVSLERASFGRATISYDYEQSAELVRLLLLDANLGARFRALLEALARGERLEPSGFMSALATGDAELDERFQTWLSESGSNAARDGGRQPPAGTDRPV
jgi:hypothetical protein